MDLPLEKSGAMIRKGLVIKDHFCAAHLLKDYDGACSNLHGHTWKVEIVFMYSERLAKASDLSMYNDLSADGLNEKFMAEDFQKLHNIVNVCLPDHEFLNSYYQCENTTAEYLSNCLFAKIQKMTDVVFNGRIWLSKVVLFESENAGAFVEITNG